MSGFLINTTQSDYLLIDRRFAAWLGPLKGPRLSVLLCLALHADKVGQSRVGLAQIARETGYGQPVVTRTLKELCCLEADGVSAVTLLGPSARGRSNVNSYALFKTAVETPTGARSQQ